MGIILDSHSPASRRRHQQGSTRFNRSELLACRHTIEMLEARDVPTNLPAGLSETLLTTNSDISSPTAMEISPVGELWALERTGAAKFIRANGTSQTAITLTVD